MGTPQTSAGLQILLRDLDDLVKPGRIVNRDFRQRHAIQFAASLLQAVDEPAVGHTARPAGGAHAHDPQAAELTLLDAAITERIDAAADQRDDRLAIEVVPAGAKALGEFACASAPFLQGHTTS